MPGFLIRVLGIKLRSLCLYSKLFADWATILVPLNTCYNKNSVPQNLLIGLNRLELLMATLPPESRTYLTVFFDRLVMEALLPSLHASELCAFPKLESHFPNANPGTKVEPCFLVRCLHELFTEWIFQSRLFYSHWKLKICCCSPDHWNLHKGCVQ